MQDGILKGTGNSRYLKSVASFLSLYPTYEDFAQALIEGTLPIDLNGINEAGWSQLGTSLNKANLLSDATAEKLGLGPVEKVDKPLSEYAEGDTVYLKEDGVLTPFIVSKHNYESDLNGAGRTLLVRKGAAGVSAWNEAGVNTYADSTIDQLLNSEYKLKLPADVQAAMGETEFYYTVGGGDTTVTTLRRAVFLLSTTEVHTYTVSNANAEGSLVTLTPYYSFFGAMRTPSTADKTKYFAFKGSYTPNSIVTTEDILYAPAFTLPEDYAPPVYYFNAILESATESELAVATPTDAFHLLADGVPVASMTVTAKGIQMLDLSYLKPGRYKVKLDTHTGEPETIQITFPSLHDAASALGFSAGGATVSGHSQSYPSATIYKDGSQFFEFELYCANRTYSVAIPLPDWTSGYIYSVGRNSSTWNAFYLQYVATDADIGNTLTVYKLR